MWGCAFCSDARGVHFSLFSLLLLRSSASPALADFQAVAWGYSFSQCIAVWARGDPKKERRNVFVDAMIQAHRDFFWKWEHSTTEVTEGMRVYYAIKSDAMQVSQDLEFILVHCCYEKSIQYKSIQKFLL